MGRWLCYAASKTQQEAERRQVGHVAEWSATTDHTKPKWLLLCPSRSQAHSRQDRRSSSSTTWVFTEATHIQRIWLLPYQALNSIARRGLLAGWPILCGSFQGQDRKLSSLYHETLMAFLWHTAKAERFRRRLPRELFRGICIIDDMLLIVLVEYDEDGRDIDEFPIRGDFMQN